MGLNRHTNAPAGQDKVCFFCSRKIERDEHAIDFQGTKEDASGYTKIWMHILCMWQLFQIMLKDARHSAYSEKMTLSFVPRGSDVEHLKIDNYKVRG